MTTTNETLPKGRIDKTPTAEEVDGAVGIAADLASWDGTKPCNFRLTRRANTLGEARAAVKAILMLGGKGVEIEIRGRGRWVESGTDEIHDAPADGFVIGLIRTRWVKVRLGLPSPSGAWMEARPLDMHGWVEVSWLIID